MRIAISVESTADMPQQAVKEHNIYVIPFHVYLNEEEFSDGVNIKTTQLFEFTDKTGVLPKTSAISDYEYEVHFENILKENDAILHFCISSEVSSSYENASRVSKKYNNVYAFNTQSLSSGISLLALSAVEKLKEGKTFKQTIEEVEDLIPKVRASFVINNLKYLYKGGRCSALALLGSNLLKIKPQIKMEKGKMQVGKKYRGKLIDVLLEYVNDILAENNPDKKRVFVTYSTLIEGTQSIVDLLKKYGFKEIYQNFAGATICSHCGRDTLGVLFINKD